MNETKTYVTVSGIDLNGSVILSILDAAGGKIRFRDGEDGYEILFSSVRDGYAKFAVREIPCGNYRMVLQFESDLGDETEFRSRGLLEIRADDNRFTIAANFTEVKPTVISVTGIGEPAAGNAETTIWRGTKTVATGEAGIPDAGEKGRHAAVALKETGSGFMFSGGGIFEIVLKLGNGGKPFAAYRIRSENLNAETTNAVPFDRFARLPTFKITLAGIPDAYAEAHARLILCLPGTDEKIVTLADRERLEIPETVITAWNVPSGTYDIVLFLSGDDGCACFRLGRQSLPKNIDAAFSDFAAMPMTTITVTGLECFNGRKLSISAGDFLGFGHGRVRDGNVVFALCVLPTYLPFNQSGSFPLTLHSDTGFDNWKIEKNIAALGNNEFTFADFGGRPAIVLTVTGIDLTENRPARIRVFSGTAEVASGSSYGSTTFVLKKTDGEPFDAPGTYSLELNVPNGLGTIHNNIYGLASKALAIDENIMPLADFTRNLITVTIDGIDVADARAASVEIFEDGKKVAYGNADIKEGKAILDLARRITLTSHNRSTHYRNEDFNTPGTYLIEIELRINDAESRKFGLASKAMMTGTNIIPFADFKEVPYNDNR